MSHSPTPWKLNPPLMEIQCMGWDIEAADGEVVAQYIDESNARLLSAAPHLLSALKQVVCDDLKCQKCRVGREAIAEAEREL